MKYLTVAFVGDALAAVDDAGKLQVVDTLPIARDHEEIWIDGQKFADALIPCLLAAGEGTIRAVIERRDALTFRHGAIFGGVMGCLRAFSVPLELIYPHAWRPSSDEKRSAIQRARAMFPGARLEGVPLQDRAEAALLAHWAVLRRPA